MALKLYQKIIGLLDSSTLRLLVKLFLKASKLFLKASFAFKTGRQIRRNE